MLTHQDLPPKDDGNFPPLTRRPSIDTTVSTTQSPMTRLSHVHTTQGSTHTNRQFEELEAAFLKHQEEFDKSATRMTTMEDRVTRTMSACEQLSKQVTNMDTRFMNMFEKLETLIMTRIPAVPLPDSTLQTSPAAPHLLSHDQSTSSDSSSNVSMASATDTLRSQASSALKSPEKKKHRTAASHTAPQTSSDIAQTPADNPPTNPSDQLEVQYNSDHLSDGGASL